MDTEEWHWILLLLRRCAISFVKWVEKRPWFKSEVQKFQM